VTPRLHLLRALGAIGLAPPTRAFIVVPSLKLAYGRVPKAANSSIKNALARHVPVDPDIDERPGRDRYWQRGKDAPVFMASGLEIATRGDGLFVFAFVRDPFDRLASCYVNKIVAPQTFPPLFSELGFRKGMPFSAFVERVAATPDVVADDHFRSQASMLMLSGHVLPSFVGRFETIDADWARVREAVEARGGPDLGPLPHVNKRRGGSDDLPAFYGDPGVVALVRRRYAEDFAAFYPGRGESL
jgi:dermatan 4-sulfotransferase 1